MAAIPLSDDGLAITYQLDDGRTVKVAKDAASRLGAPMPSPAPLAMPSTTWQMPAAPPEPIAAPAAESAPVMAPAMVPPQPEEAPQPTLPPPVPAKPKAQPKQQPPGLFGEQLAAGNEAHAMQAQAIDERAIAEHAANQRVLGVLEQRNQQAEAIEAKRQADADSSMQEIERRSSAVDAAIEDYGKTKINPNRLADSLGTSKKAALIFFQAMAGLGHALKGEGGKNPAIDMWLAQIDQDIRLQMDARDQKRAQIGEAKDALARVKDLAQTRQGQYALAMAAETDKAARVLEQIATQTKLDTVRANALDARGRLLQESATWKGEWAKTEFGAQMQIRDQRERERHARVSEAQGWAGQKLAREKFAEDKLMNRAGLQLQYDKLQLEANQLDQAGRIAEAKALREQAENTRKFGAMAPPKVATDSTGKPVIKDDGSLELTREPLRNKDGSLWMAPTEDEAKDLRNKMDKAHRLVSILDEVRSIRDKVGGESSLANSPYRQRLDVLKEQLVLLRKEGTEGMSSDADMARLERALGVSDVASFRSQVGRLDEARKQVVESLNSEMRFKGGYTGPAFEFPDYTKMDARATAEDKQTQALMAKPSMSVTAARSTAQDVALSEPRFRGKTQRDFANDPQLQREFRARVDELSANYKEITPAQIHDIGKLGEQAASAPDENTRRWARQTLVTLAERGQTSAIRNTAQLALQTAVNVEGYAGLADEHVGPRTAGAREPMPMPRGGGR